MGRKINKFQRRLFSLIFLLNLNSQVYAEILDKSINNHKEQFELVAMDLWNFAELGYQENNSTARLITELEKEGFTIKSNLAGIPTAFIAEYSNGGPVIGILGEYDALQDLPKHYHHSKKLNLMPLVLVKPVVTIYLVLVQPGQL